MRGYRFPETAMRTTMTNLKTRFLPLLLSFCILSVSMPNASGLLQAQQQQPPGSSAASPAYTGQGVPLTPQELQSLVAPIALYPDALVAQTLNAATFPDQVAVANYWLSQNKNLTGNALVQAVNGQSWDPSVKALIDFPSVLNNLAQNLSWTSQLGEAYHNQQSEVMAAIQTLRAQAKAAGNLKTTPQQTVTSQSQNGQQVIVIQPTNPQVVYVPQYNPTVVYGTPYTVPSYSTGDMVATGLLSFGAGMAMGALAAGWSCNWYGGGAYYHGAPYYGNPAWHGGYNNAYGYHPYDNGYNANRYHPTSYNGGYNSTGYHPNNYNRNTNVSGNTVNVNRGDSGNSNSMDRSGWSNSDASRGWGSQDSGSRNTAFSGYGDHSRSDVGSGGWGDRSASSRGWSSRGGGGGWGGGRFGGGGFRGGGRR